MRIPLWLKIGWSLWVLVWIPVYWHQYGVQNFLYFCDLGNLFICAALWLESPLLFSWQACGLLLFQTLYIVDLIGALVSGRHVIGGTEYMFDPHLPLAVRLLVKEWPTRPVHIALRTPEVIDWNHNPRRDRLILPTPPVVPQSPNRPQKQRRHHNMKQTEQPHK